MHRTAFGEPASCHSIPSHRWRSPKRPIASLTPPSPREPSASASPMNSGISTATLSSPWYARYGRRVENYHRPKTDAARAELARIIAADGERLLAAVDAATDQPVLAQIPTVLTLRRVWAEPYTGAPGQLHWRAVKDMP